MRAREFVTEQRAKLSPLDAGPLQHAYVVPGIRNNDSYHTYRLGMAMARARAEIGGETEHFSTYPDQSAFGQNAVVVGFNDSVDQVIDLALKLTKTPGGKEIIGTKESEEPTDTLTQSPVKAFKGYPR